MQHKRLWLAAVASAWLAGCGGGVYLTVGDDGYRDEPPSVELVVASSSVLAGQNVRLVAAAADDGRIDEVIFYRYDGNTAVRLGNDRSAPYELVMQVPDDGRGSVSVFARAYDDAGQVGNSELVTLSIAL